MKVRKLNALLIGALTAPVLLVNGTALASAMVYSQAGDVTDDSAVLWARCNSEKKSLLTFRIFPEGDDVDKHDDDVKEHRYDSAYQVKSHRVRDGRKRPDRYHQEKSHDNHKGKTITRIVDEDSDFTASVVVRGLEEDTAYRYQAMCELRSGASGSRTRKGPVGSFTTAADEDDDEAVDFIWVADLAGQGWGRSPHLSIMDTHGEVITGGYVIFDVISKLEPDFALFQGDMIYADNPIPPTKEIPASVDGGTWVNDPTKDFVAITLDEFRENWTYNLGDPRMAGFLAKTPVYAQWDDHEVTNNWYPGEIMPEGEPYYGIAVDILAKRAKRALFEYNPIDGREIYRKFQHGKHMELFLLDERSYRGPNTANTDPKGIEMLGERQFQWLKHSLKTSKATWKVIATHDPLSIVTGGPGDYDSWGQGDEKVLGREVQLKQLLRFIKKEGIRNVVYLTADVHFTAAVSYEPERAKFKHFEPFWEFVIGPINAGAFGAGDLDTSFGPKYEYLRAPSTAGIDQNSPPPNLQSFGAVEIDEDGKLTVKLVDITGAVLYEKTLLPEDD